MSPHHLNELSSARVLVVGDLILDRYWHGASERISPEAPVPVVRVEQQLERVGGAANVAANVAALGASASLIGWVGADADGERLAGLCREGGVSPHFVSIADATTIVKLRVVSQRQQIVRADFEASELRDYSNDVTEHALGQLDSSQLVVISDYAKGAVNEVSTLITTARARGIPVIVDPKGRNFERYRGASLITPNLNEFQQVAGVCSNEAQLVERARRLVSELGLEAILVTRGADGMSLICADGQTHHVGAQAHDVFDVTGAGDTVCAVLAAALASKHDLPAAMTLANAAAGLVVGKFGAATVSVPELKTALTQSAAEQTGIVSAEQVRLVREQAGKRGERVVMTNGCFDVLHAGHVRYLKAARALGDRLIVAVNDDDSVRELKGSLRPVNSLADRMEVLAGLTDVDWVVPFSESTPAILISAVLPDVLVKGGDYEPQQIAGAQAVMAAGGEVRIVEFHRGYSTTKTLQRIAMTEQT